LECLQKGGVVKNLRADIERYYLLTGRPVIVSPWRVLVAWFNPRLLPVVFLRVSAFFYRHHLGPLAKLFTLLNVLLFGIEVSPRIKIGGGLFLPHTVGTVIGAESIGQNVTIMHGVTLGARELDFHFTAFSRPVIGNNVFIGAGAKVVGSVTIGDNAKIGANAVVLQDVPAYALAVGVPAKILGKLAVEG
jgi:serine O-acetyltransferase